MCNCAKRLRNISIMNDTFSQLSRFAGRRRKIKLAAPEDIVEVVPRWSPEQLALEPDQRGRPDTTTFGIREGAETLELEVVPLSLADSQRAEAFLDEAMPPRLWTDEPPEKPGQPMRRVPGDFDETDPSYLANLRPLQARRDAFIALRGVVGLWDSTAGSDESAKIATLQETMPAVVIRYLAGLIYRLSFVGGDLADFFTSAGSGASPSSKPLPKPNQKAAKPK
jgi:hypothetical protein